MLKLTIGNLTKEGCKQIKHLQRQCALVDGYTFPVYEELWPQRMQTAVTNIDMFVWEQTTLIAYAGVFFFNAELPEIILLVTPAWRRQGIAKTLLQHVSNKLAELTIDNFLLVTLSSALHPLLLRYQGVQHHSELTLQVNEWLSQPVKHQSTLRLAKANQQDLNCLVALHQACFNSPEASNRERFAVNLKEDNYFAYILYQQDLPIAKLHVRANAAETKLFDIGVIALCQQQGYGCDLMQSWFNLFGKKFKRPIVLEIMGDNIAALKLYQKCGFQVIRQFTYWQLQVKKTD